jgi:hypothetical protein
MIEGMAEYLSVGQDDALTAMWMRDAIRRDDLPTIKQMTRETRFFPYRFGQALWIYVGSTYGDDAAVQLFRRALRTASGRHSAGARHVHGHALRAVAPEQVDADYRR